MLTRYWFTADRGFGFGVTAKSVADAELLLASAGFVPGRDFETGGVLENVDVRTLDQNHVVPNMGSPNIRGVWFPRLNL
jgi:hypothetical protein